MRLLFLMLFVFSYNCSFAQLGSRFAPNHSAWEQKTGFFAVPSPSSGHSVSIGTNKSSIIKNDTVINNKLLQKLYCLDISIQYPTDTTCVSFSNYLFYDSNKVFIGNHP